MHLLFFKSSRYSDKIYLNKSHLEKRALVLDTLTDTDNTVHF